MEFPNWQDSELSEAIVLSTCTLLIIIISVIQDIDI